MYLQYTFSVNKTAFCTVYKLDQVGPVDNKRSTNKLYQCVKEKNKIKICPTDLLLKVFIRHNMGIIRQK